MFPGIHWNWCLEILLMLLNILFESYLRRKIVITRQLLLDICDVICVMTSHPRSLLVQRLVLCAWNGMYVCICVCIDGSMVDECWVHSSYFNVNTKYKTLKVLSWWRIFTKKTLFSHTDCIVSYLYLLPSHLLIYTTSFFI